MNFSFINKCSVNIFVSMNDREKFVLRPHENKVITLDNFSEINLIVRKENESFLEKSFFRKKYKLTIETTYQVSTMDNELLTLVFLRECVRVGGNVYYEKIVLKNKPAHCIEKSNVVCGLNSIRKTYNKRRLTYLLLVSPFEHMTLLCLVAFVLAIVFACKINIVFSLLFFLISYVLIIGMDFIVAKLSDKFHKKVLNVENEKEEFEKFLEENFLNSFYSNNCKDAFNGEIFIDEL